jgi:hypothetical protein
MRIPSARAHCVLLQCRLHCGDSMMTWQQHDMQFMQRLQAMPRQTAAVMCWGSRCLSPMVPRCSYTAYSLQQQQSADWPSQLIGMCSCRTL